MRKTKTSTSSEANTKRNEYAFSVDTHRRIEISSNFENGNISLVKQVNELYYILEALNDVENVSSRKCWFHFKAKSERGLKVRMIVQNVSIYDNIFEDKLYCKPMVKEGSSGSWQQATQAFFSYRDELELIIDHTFKNSQDVYFCLSIPFTYSENEQYLDNLKSKIHPCIDYTDQILTLTPNGNNVHLLTISESRQEATKNNKQGSEDSKPVILITARVHPGEVSSSFCLQGILQFILSYNNLQAYLLRRLFVFKIVPMLNPDGVIEGNYRADPQGFNLNRFYLEPSKQQQPAIFQIQKLIKKISLKQKIQFYFDLHSHSCIKQSFIYGNAHDDIVNQTYSQLFCKVLEQNFPRFRYYLSNFGQQHMKHKDRGQALTKQGCGRVAISKLCGVICSYTMQSSIFPAAYSPYLNKTHKSQEKNKQFHLCDSGSKKLDFEIEKDELKRQNILVAENKRLGSAMMVTVLDVIEKNPYTRLKQGYISNFYKQVSLKLLQNQERFKMMDIKAHQKMRMILEYIKNRFDDVIDRQWNLAGLIGQINSYDWPPQFRKISIINDAGITKNNITRNIYKKNRFKTEPKDRFQKLTSISQHKHKTKFVTEKDKLLFDSNRTISPNPNPIKPIKTFLPEIKYSVQMKVPETKGPLLAKSNSIKQTNLKYNEQPQMPKLVMIDYVNEEIAKLQPDKSEKQMLKHNNSSLNRLIASKMLEKQKNRSRNFGSRDLQFVLQTRKRIATVGLEEADKQGCEQAKHRQKLSLNQDDFRPSGHSDLKRTDLIKKKMFLTNKAIQLFKKNDKNKMKLPEVSKINLVVQNSKKDLRKGRVGEEQKCAEE